MPTPSHLSLTQEQEAELVHARDHAPQPYLRERAAMLLKIAAGHSIRAVARTGGLKPHHRDSVCGWVARSQTEGLAGLLVRKGRDSWARLLSRCPLSWHRRRWKRRFSDLPASLPCPALAGGSLACSR